MTRLLFKLNSVIIICVTIISTASAQFKPEPLCPESKSVVGIESPAIRLNDGWEFSLDEENWHPVIVPGEPAMQGFNVEYDKPFYYRRKITIPKDFGNAHILLRFHGVYGYARVFANGKLVREHRGSFTAWDCDLTKFSKTGKSIELRLEIVDEPNDISMESWYAKHPIGGILRKVEMIALPEIHFRHLYLDASLNKDFTKGLLTIRAKMSKHIPGTSLQLTLRTPDGSIVQNHTIDLPQQKWWEEELKISPVLPWDAEHPNLYTIELALKIDTTIASWTRRIGFRTIEVEGNDLFVNGKKVFLKGACRHDMHPTLGRSTTPEYDRMDAEITKRMNLNFIRTSHYPPTSDFLDACDELGIYVEDENASAFAGFPYEKSRYKIPFSHKSVTQTIDDPGFLDYHLSQVAEMIEAHRNHPSIIIWSLSNEHQLWGKNLAATYDYVKAADTSRPVMFSFPFAIPPDVPVPYDILSSHYPRWDKLDMVSQPPLQAVYPQVMPILHDECAHVACYCLQLLKDDPNTRNFWGEGIKKVWDNMYVSKRGLGSAIWGLIDEVFMLPGNPVGWGPWGLVDVWRREKPEFYLARKAHSPVRVISLSIDRPQNAQALSIPVENRYDHTFLNELSVQYIIGKTVGNLAPPSIAPHAKGHIYIPGKNWDEIDNFQLIFIDRFSNEIERELISLKKDCGPCDNLIIPPVQSFDILESDTVITLRSNETSVSIDKESGLISSIVLKGSEILSGTIYPVVEDGVDSTATKAKHWKMIDLSHTVKNDSLTVTVTGEFTAGMKLIINQKITSAGLNVTYQILPSNKNLRSYNHIGISIPMKHTVNTIKWNRNALWSLYPENHIGRPVGTANKAKLHDSLNYREKPTWDFIEDSHDNYVFNTTSSKGFNAPLDFIAARRNINYFMAISSDDNTGITIVKNSKKSTHCQATVAPNGEITLRALNQINYNGLNWGNYSGEIHSPKKKFEGQINIIFTKPTGRSLINSSKRHKKQRKEENIEQTPTIHGRGTFH